MGKSMVLVNSSEARLAIEDCLDEGDLDGALNIAHTLWGLCHKPADLEMYLGIMEEAFDEKDFFTEADRRKFYDGLSDVRLAWVENRNDADLALSRTLAEATA